MSHVNKIFVFDLFKLYIYAASRISFSIPILYVQLIAIEAVSKMQKKELLLATEVVSVNLTTCTRHLKQTPIKTKI